MKVVKECKEYEKKRLKSSPETNDSIENVFGESENFLTYRSIMSCSEMLETY